jgi:hypothetical protein
MKRKTHLHTNFIKFILEKYNKDEKIPDEDTNVSDKEIIDDIDEIDNPDEVQNEDDETIEDLIKEFNELEKKYKTLRNDNKIHNKK